MARLLSSHCLRVSRNSPLVYQTARDSGPRKPLNGRATWAHCFSMTAYQPEFPSERPGGLRT
eukprot:113355-Rhodomonas_salina.3